jgi:NAD(P)-dependent dehydrogenase (short-subunit alcohol dehydrogenase family)
MSNVREDFRGKIALVTGAAAGIGRSIAAAFAEAGAKTVLSDNNDEWGPQIAAEMRDNGQDVVFVAADITRAADVDALFAAAVDRYGGVDVVVNSPGIRAHDDVVDFRESDWDAQIAVQLKGPFLTCRAGARQMIAQGRGGSIINIGSAVSAIAHTGMASHGASKAGLNQLTKVLAMEVGKHGITANVVAPGLIRPAWPARKAPVSDEYARNYVSGVPIGRLGEAIEIAHAVLFFASDRARFITGQVLYVDGGHTAGKLSMAGTSPSWIPQARP